MLARLQLDPARKRLISGFIDEYLRLTIEQRQEFDAEMEQLIPQEKEGVMEIVTSWMEEGLAKGLVQGREEGERGLLMRQLRGRLGQIDPSAAARIGTLGIDVLEELGDAVFDFTSHADLDRWLDAHHP